MSIEIYNKAKIIHKDGIYYYFLKHHSKNDCICGGQFIVDDNFNNKYIRRNYTGGDWKIKAHGTEKEREEDTIAKTYWNCPQSAIYGLFKPSKIQNIALYWAKLNKNKWQDIKEFTEHQQKNINEIINWYNREDNKYKCDLKDIPEKYKHKEIEEYCGNHFHRFKNYIEYYGNIYWNLNNL